MLQWGYRIKQTNAPWGWCLILRAAHVRSFILSISQNNDDEDCSFARKAKTNIVLCAVSPNHRYYCGKNLVLPGQTRFEPKRAMSRTEHIE